MAIECLAAVINARRAPWVDGTLTVLLAMANYADPDGSNIFPSQERLARQCRMTPRNVRRCIDRLLEDGVLSLVDAATGKRGVFDQYQICMDRVRSFEGCAVCGGVVCDEKGCPKPADKLSAGRRATTGHLRHNHRTLETKPPDISDSAYRKTRHRPVIDPSAETPRAPERRGDPAIWKAWEARLDPALVRKLEAYDAEPVSEGGRIVLCFPKALARDSILRHRRDISKGLPSNPAYRFAGVDLEGP